MDDLTLGGVRGIHDTVVVVADTEYISNKEQLTDLLINASKSEIISHGPDLLPRNTIQQILFFSQPDEADLLGALLFTDRKMDAALISCCAE